MYCAKWRAKGKTFKAVLVTIGAGGVEHEEFVAYKDALIQWCIDHGGRESIIKWNEVDNIAMFIIKGKRVPMCSSVMLDAI